MSVHLNPSRFQQEYSLKTKVWCVRVEQSSSEKNQVVELAGKVIATVFWDNNGVLLID